MSSRRRLKSSHFVKIRYNRRNSWKAEGKDMTYSEQWDLETIFKGGLASPALENRLKHWGK